MSSENRNGWKPTRIPEVSILWRDGFPVRVSVILEPSREPMLDPSAVVEELTANGCTLRDYAAWEDGDRPHEIQADVTRWYFETLEYGDRIRRAYELGTDPTPRKGIRALLLRLLARLRRMGDR